MKKIFTLLAIVPLATAAFGQAITITSTDMPVPTSPYHLRNFTTSTAANPAIGTSATWDYSTYTNTPDSAVYVTETDTFFTHAGVDVYRLGFKSILSGLGYNVYSEYDFNAANVQESAMDILEQHYSISALTGATTDSLIVPAQRQIFTTPKKIINFPFTANTTWSTSGRRSVNFNLTVVAASLSNAPVQHVFYSYRKDTIVGWGKMKVYSSAGPAIPSIQYDVLMDKIAEYATDSFYMGGSPANPVLLASFGLSQGQHTDSSFRYNFFRKTSFYYLVNFNFGADPTYTTPVSKYMSSDNITPANVGVNEVNAATYTTVLFPNPANANEVNLMISGKDVTGGNYTITDMSGKAVQTGAIEMKQGVVHVVLNSLANGNYVINVLDNANNRVATEQFTVAK